MATEGGKTIARRDLLLEIEEEVQTWRTEKNVFGAESHEKTSDPGKKFFGNFPFPYMNGFLHLGIAFSLSKLQFAAAYHRLRGTNVVLPFAFYCTGMPIKAAADKLAREINEFVDSPAIPKEVEDMENQTPELKEQNAREAAMKDKFKEKKSKAKA